MKVIKSTLVENAGQKTGDYYKSGRWYSLALSVINMPLILGVTNGGNFHSYAPIIVGILLISSLNYAYVVAIRNIKYLQKSNWILIVLNFIVLITASNVAGSFYRIEMGVAAFSVFLYIPGAFFIRYTYLKHSLTFDDN